MLLHAMYICGFAKYSALFLFNFFMLQTSDTHKQMMEILDETGFVTQEYILSPLQFGVPYSRPRYFCLVAHFLYVFILVPWLFMFPF